MALVTSLGVLLAVGVFALFIAAAGHRLLRVLAVELPSNPEHTLCCSAIGTIFIQVLIFLAQLLGHIRIGIVSALLFTALLGIADLKFVVQRVSRCFKSAVRASKLEKFLLSTVMAALVLEGFAAMAPLTGSDALHYHFTAPVMMLNAGFHPNFFLSHSFFTGQSHLLILAGLALGSPQLSMGFLILGGALATASAVCLARRWASRGWALTVGVLLLLTPVIFWQISSAGSPDLWMAYFATMGVLVIARSAELQATGLTILVGVLAGGVAGAKYTGCIVAASIAVAYFWENRSLRSAAIFLFSFLCAGVWPYARNFIWSGDPVFPFLLQRLSPERVNTVTLASYLADTRANAHMSALQILKFPFFAGVDPLHSGFWEFFGPIVLVFAPLILLAIRNTPLWRAAMIAWVLSALGIATTSAMTRFLLPVFPIAVAATIAATAHFMDKASRPVRFVILGTIGFFVVMGGSGLLLYDRSALAAAAGFTSHDDYLRQRAPEYEKVAFINRVLAEKGAEGNTLVFLRHGYYLRVPFIYGDPAASWAIDPNKFQTTEEWITLFHRQDIRWVVRSPAYPPTIATPLNQLEAEGKLVPFAEAEVSDFQGMRLSGERRDTPIVILQVR